MKDKKEIQEILNEIDNGDKIYIDVGCSYISNLPEKFILNGNKTLFFEIDSEKASQWTNSNNFEIINEKVTPDNVCELIFSRIGKNKNITFLDIDIDGYDFFVLESLLKENRPYLIVAEINEKIPFPIKFSVKYKKTYSWGCNHFYGMSLAKFNELAEKYEYDLIELTANNVYAIRRDKNIKFKKFSAEQIYNEKYKNLRLDNKLQDFDYNLNVDYWLSLNENECLKEINNFFKNYKDEYEIYI